MRSRTADTSLADIFIWTKYCEPIDPLQMEIHKLYTVHIIFLGIFKQSHNEACYFNLC
jgi:hypothetical protein